MPRVEQLYRFRIAVVSRPGVVEIVANGDSTGCFGIPEGRGRLLVDGRRQLLVGADSFAHCLDEFRIGSRIRFGHSLLAVPGIAVP